MSAFKKRTPSNQPLPPPGTRPCPLTPSVRMISTGVSSLDDILGGGQPLGSVMVILTPDPHSAWGALLQKYYIAQGLASQQGICVVGDPEFSKELIEGCMWTSDLPYTPTEGGQVISEDEGDKGLGDGKVAIAWRYENMKPFQTTVRASNHGSSDDYIHTLDLTARIPPAVLAKASQDGRLVVSPLGERGHQIRDPYSATLRRIKETLVNLGVQRPATEGQSAKTRQGVVRLSIHDLGGSLWGMSSPSKILHFLHTLRTLLQEYSCAALVTLPWFLSQPSPNIPNYPPEGGWVEKISFLTDACLSLSSFGDDPMLASMFPAYHGLVHVHCAPSLHSLTPPSHRLSVLRGLGSTSSQSNGGGENNLGFRCTRKRLVIETLHLDVEGGVGERRTTPSVSSAHEQHKHSHSAPIAGKGGEPLLSLEVSHDHKELQSSPPKTRKKVAFHSDRPDLYDF